MGVFRRGRYAKGKRIGKGNICEPVRPSSRVLSFCSVCVGPTNAYRSDNSALLMPPIQMHNHRQHNPGLERFQSLHCHTKPRKAVGSHMLANVRGL